MSRDELKKKVAARLLAAIVIISMIMSLTGCNELKEQESGAALVYGNSVKNQIDI